MSYLNPSNITPIFFLVFFLATGTIFFVTKKRSRKEPTREEAENLLNARKNERDIVAIKKAGTFSEVRGIYQNTLPGSSAEALAKAKCDLFCKACLQDVLKARSHAELDRAEELAEFCHNELAQRMVPYMREEFAIVSVKAAGTDVEKLKKAIQYLTEKGAAERQLFLDLWEDFNK